VAALCSIDSVCGVNVTFCVFCVHREMVYFYYVKTFKLPASLFPQIISCLSLLHFAGNKKTHCMQQHIYEYNFSVPNASVALEVQLLAG
jgi:hypothetical protein